MKETHINGMVTFHINDIKVRMSNKSWLEYIAWKTKAVRTINLILES